MLWYPPKRCEMKTCIDFQYHFPPPSIFFSTDNVQFRTPLLRPPAVAQNGNPHTQLVTPRCLQEGDIRRGSPNFPLPRWTGADIHGMFQLIIIIYYCLYLNPVLLVPMRIFFLLSFGQFFFFWHFFQTILSPIYCYSTVNIWIKRMSKLYDLSVFFSAFFFLKVFALFF